MSKVWILSLTICSGVFFFLRFIPQSRSFYYDLIRLTYGPMLAHCSASALGSGAATFVLFFSMGWAAGNLGYFLALHPLLKGTERAIHAVPISSYPTKNIVIKPSSLYPAAPILVVIWTSALALFFYLLAVTDELDILMLISFFGWVHAAFWLIVVVLGPMKDFPLEQVDWLVAVLFPSMLVSPAIWLVSKILAVLSHLLLMMALVAFLWYNIAIYIHFLATATPSTTTEEDKDTQHSKTLEARMGRQSLILDLQKRQSEAAATLGNERYPVCSS